MFDLLWILAGPAWLVKEGVKEMCESVDASNRSELIKNYVSEHTDIELEKKYEKELKNACSNLALCRSIWEKLEIYKRDNPVWCYEQIRKSSPKLELGWQDVGHKRVLPSRSRCLVLNMLLDTHGKVRHDLIWDKVKEVYPNRPKKSLFGR